MAVILTISWDDTPGHRLRFWWSRPDGGEPDRMMTATALPCPTNPVRIPPS